MLPAACLPISARAPQGGDPAIPYTVTFNGGDSTGGVTAPQTAAVPAALTANGFTRTGYAFAGWNTSVSGGGTPYADSANYAFAQNETLYAQWLLLRTVTFDGNGSDGGGTAPQAASAPAALSLNGFTLTDYIFAGWNTASGGNGTAYADGANYDFAADLILYAQWSAA